MFQKQQALLTQQDSYVIGCIFSGENLRVAGSTYTELTYRKEAAGQLIRLPTGTTDCKGQSFPLARQSSSLFSSLCGPWLLISYLESGGGHIFEIIAVILRQKDG